MIPITIKLLETKPPDMVVREWRQIRRETHRAIGEHWYANMLPRHFDSNAHFVYGYRQRSRAYLQQLRKAASGRGILKGKVLSPVAATAQLTLSGQLHLAMTARGKIIRSFPTRFTGKMPGLPYTPKKQRSSRQPHLAGELTKILRREAVVLRRVGRETAKRLIAEARANRTTIAK